MKKQLIKQWIGACDELIKRYKNDNHVTSDCPLCVVAGGNDGDHCKNCLWAKFEKIACHHTSACWGNGNKKRIMRINRWKRRLSTMLKDG